MKKHEKKTARLLWISISLLVPLIAYLSASPERQKDASGTTFNDQWALAGHQKQEDKEKSRLAYFALQKQYARRTGQAADDPGNFSPEQLILIGISQQKGVYYALLQAGEQLLRLKQGEQTSFGATVSAISSNTVELKYQNNDSTIILYEQKIPTP